MGADPVPRDPRLAVWLITRRREIERALAARLGDTAPAPAAPEAEALRRFRSFVSTALQRGAAPAPSLDGLRVSEARVTALLTAWTECTADAAGPQANTVRAVLEPLAARFGAALRDTAPARRRSGAPRTRSRAVRAAIDRVADGYLAIDVDSRRIVDANPAAGALLQTTRDALLGANAATFVPEAERESWWAHLDSLVEGGDTRRFPSRLCDAAGSRVGVEVSLSRHAQRSRTLALALLRPLDS
jgi:PAS domain S-box-containing protein